jgi:hypothetical protein
MKNTITSLSVLLLLSFVSNAQNETFDWAGSIGGGSYDLGSAITTDAAGNVYSTGAVQGSAIDMDPGPLGSFVVANGGYDTYVHKVDANGYLEWAKTFGGTQNDVGLDIALDPSGNILVTGHFFGTTDFDPGAGVTQLSSNGDRDIFILKLDANGDFLWARSFGEDDDDFGQSIATDANGNVIVTGKFQGTVDFDPGSGTTNLTSNGIEDAFILKLDGDGNLLWANSIGGPGNDRGQAVTTDANGNIYTTGTFIATVDFDPGVGVQELSTGGAIFDVFIQKLDTDGNLVWAKVMGGSNWDFGHGIAVDASENVYTTGYFNNTVDFDPGPGTANLSSNGGADIFVQKLDANGDFLWVKSMGGSSDDKGNAIAVSPNGNVFTTGEFGSSVDFDPGSGTNILSAGGYTDIYIQKLAPNGDFLWAEKFGAVSSDIGQGIHVDDDESIYSTGYFGSTVDFDPGPGTTSLTAVGGDSEIYILKFEQPTTVGVSESAEQNALSVFPNPSNGNIRILLNNWSKTNKLSVYDVAGKLINTETFSSNSIEYLLPEQKGIYIISVQTDTRVYTQKIIRQ